MTVHVAECLTCRYIPGSLQDSGRYASDSNLLPLDDAAMRQHVADGHEVRALSCGHRIWPECLDPAKETRLDSQFRHVTRRP